MNYPKSSCRRPLHSLTIIAVLTSVVCAFAASASPTDSAVRVDLRHINLSTAAGQAEAKERLLQAAHLTCGRVEDEEDLSRHDNYLACVKTVLNKAMQQLAQLVSRSDSAQFAGNASK
jgi:UrcA family protein